MRTLGLPGQDPPMSQREKEAGSSGQEGGPVGTHLPARQGQRWPRSRLGPGSELGCRAPAWASNSRWCSFCDLNSTPCEPCDLWGGQGPGGQEASLSTEQAEGGLRERE